MHFSTVTFLAALLVSHVHARAVTLQSRFPPSFNRTPKEEPALPVSGVSPELPAVPEGLVLKRIVLGHGYQNYTCSGEGATAEATGALAVLYDAMALYPGQSPFSVSLEQFLGLTGPALLQTAVPLATAPNTRVDQSAEGASADPFPKAPVAPLDLSAAGVQPPLPYVGVHFFDAQKVPRFELTNGEKLLAAKLASQPAPANATAGPNGEPAAPWLYIGDVGGSVCLTAGYRVETAGGTPHTCSGAGDDSSVYTAYYFLYGPPK
ncbi:hypothetical protein HOO65_090296 [Ceratocystis lukuohia]|uniref:Malate dehydrogenase n=1 Tax=Ceratocystis lukuohia TaxID=2019550 RepID=A0ABR4M9Q9_9PEZI